jgi:hypothetical protein
LIFSQDKKVTIALLDFEISGELPSSVSVVLAVYSHMIYRALYLPDYAIGNVIQFQLEDYLKGKKIGVEIPRMIAAGNIIPQLWMKNAVGQEISVKPLLQSVDKALTVIKTDFASI